MKLCAMSLLGWLALTAGGCKSTAVQEDRPARIVNPTAESNEELQRAVSDMLFGVQVSLGPDALTDSSVLVVEHNRVRSLDNPPLSGRDLDRPERFQLVTVGGACVLIHDKDQARKRLFRTECVAAD